VLLRKLVVVYRRFETAYWPQCQGSCSPRRMLGTGGCMVIQGMVSHAGWPGTDHIISSTPKSSPPNPTIWTGWWGRRELELHCDNTNRKEGVAVRGSSKSPIHSLQECSCAHPQPPEWLICSCFLSLRCLFSYPLALNISIIHWVHSPGISPSSNLQFYSWSFSFLLPFVFYFFPTFPCALTFCLPFFLSISCIQALLPAIFILPLLSQVFPFWPLCSFSSVSLLSPPPPPLPPMLQPVWFACFPWEPINTHTISYITMLPPVPGIILRLLDPWWWDRWAAP
jgi:hypothetical protein